MTTQTKDLPPLPKPAVHAFSDINESFLRANHYTADQMHEYALEAIRASATSAPSQTDAGKLVQPLSDEQIDAINIRTLGHRHFARAILEAAHGIGTASQPADNKP